MKSPVNFRSYLTIGCILLLAGCGIKKGAPEHSLADAPSSMPPKEEIASRPKKQIKHMTVDEAIEAARFYETSGHQDLLIATCEHIINKGKDPDIVAAYGIKLADTYLSDENFAEAKKYYKKVINLYPGYRGIERARYREILAHFLSALAPTRDQSSTQTVIQLGKLYVTDFGPEGQGSGQIRSMIAASYHKLLASELLILNFYLNKFRIGGGKSALHAAWMRMTGIIHIILPQAAPYLTHAQRLLAELANLPEKPTFDSLDDPSEQQTILHTMESFVERCTLLQDALQGLEIANTVPLRDRF